jgi:cell division control protein 45
MLHSEYVSTKLQVWNKAGEHKLMELLAKMGYPLDECRQPYAFMKPSLRRRLLEKFSSHAQVRRRTRSIQRIDWISVLIASSHVDWDMLFYFFITVPRKKDYNLEHFQYSSFFRVTGYSSLLSASDTSYAVTALLEYEPPTEETSSPADDGNDPASADDGPSAAAEAFNTAYDALGTHMEPTGAGGGAPRTGTEGYDPSNLVNGGNLSATIGLGAGIRHAMTLQRCIIQTAVGLVDRNAVALLRHFRYAYVTSSSSSTTSTMGGNHHATVMPSRTASGNDRRDHIFSKPLALTRLAHYLMDMNRENGRWTGPKARPLVLIAERPRTGTCLVVGYEYPERAGNFVRNRFGRHFEMTAQSMNGTFKFDSFDSNVVEVAGADVNRFLEQLHYLLDSM